MLQLSEYKRIAERRLKEGVADHVNQGVRSDYVDFSLFYVDIISAATHELWGYIKECYQPLSLPLSAFFHRLELS